jgi:hypothetical protein
MPSSISFRPKPSDFGPCVNRLKLILPVPEVVFPSLYGKIVESQERHYCEIRWSDRSGRASSISFLTIIRIKGELGDMLGGLQALAAPCIDARHIEAQAMHLRAPERGDQIPSFQVTIDEHPDICSEGN